MEKLLVMSSETSLWFDKAGLLWKINTVHTHTHTHTHTQRKIVAEEQTFVMKKMVDLPLLRWPHATHLCHNRFAGFHTHYLQQHRSSSVQGGTCVLRKSLVHALYHSSHKFLQYCLWNSSNLHLMMAFTCPFEGRSSSASAFYTCLLKVNDGVMNEFKWMIIHAVH